MTWQIDLVLFYLGTALLFYVLFAGADFGAGILELFLGGEKRHEQRHLITRAMAPVWEANHVWIVLVVVILFMAFPPLYSAISIHLFIPVLALLVGVVFRGCAFTFRHYDTDKTYYEAYSWAFSLSSLWSAFFLGLTGGAFLYGNLLPNAPDFSTLYLAPWWNPFCVSLGLFTVCLFAFLAAVFLVGEATDPEVRQIFRRKAVLANVALVLVGAAVFWFGEREPLALRTQFFRTPLSVACFVVAGLLWVPFWVTLRRAGGGQPILGESGGRGYRRVGALWLVRGTIPRGFAVRGWKPHYFFTGRRPHRHAQRPFEWTCGGNFSNFPGARLPV